MRSPLLLLIALAACTPAAPEAPAAHPVRIAEDVRVPYDRDQHPRLYELLAAEADPEARIQRARETFAAQVAAHPACNEVELSDINIDGSSSTSLLVFAYCTNGTDRLRFRAAEAIVDPTSPLGPDLACPLSGGPCRRI